MIDPVIIGDATLAGPPLFFHVARLAKPDQVRAGVGLFGGSKVPVGHDVMHRQGIADVLSAVSAIAILLGNNLRANFKPTLSRHPINGCCSLKPTPKPTQEAML